MTDSPDDRQGIVEAPVSAAADDPAERWRDGEFSKLFEELVTLLDRRDRLDAKLYDVRSRIKDLMDAREGKE